VGTLKVCLGGLGGLGLERQGKIPGQEFLDAADGMISDLGQYAAEIELRVEAVQLRRLLMGQLTRS
jgi:hypothetical protein